MQCEWRSNQWCDLFCRREKTPQHQRSQSPRFGPRPRFKSCQCAVVFGTLPGPTHSAVVQCQEAAKLCRRVETRIQTAMTSEFGAKAPALLVPHFQLNVRSWLEEVWECNMTMAASELVERLRAHMRSNRFDWLPSFDNVSTIASIGAAPAAPVPTPAPVRRAEVPPPPPGAPVPNRAPNLRRDPCCLGDTPFTINIHTGSIRNTIAVAGRDPPQVTRGGRLMPSCPSWHVKGNCQEDCAR